jgi:phospholipid-binding lipoprotein MlaA
MGLRPFLLAAALGAALTAGAARADDAAAPPSHSPSDPWETFNRSTFWFNDQILDRYVIGPAANVWTVITPRTVRVHLEQFFDNLNFPGYFVNPLLQGDPLQSGVALSRFAINTTVGIGGVFDPAQHYLGLARRREDMGQTLGVWGVPPGPYLVVPVFFPATCLRDFVVFPVDQALNVGDSSVWPTVFSIYGETAVRDINRRALAADALASARQAALDWYSAARDGYLQRRATDIRNGEEAAPAEAPTDLYDLPEDPNSP